jgi:hypothetical protein
MTSRPQPGGDAPNAGFKDGLEPGALDHAVHLIHQVCCLAGSTSLITECRNDLKAQGIRAAIAGHDTAALFEWLAAGVSYQGIADRVAYQYMERHGRVTWQAIAKGFADVPSCPKLKSYWHFHGCRYQKGAGTCAEPDHFPGCPLPRHDLRNGHLNQAAYSLFLFIRDIAGWDLVAWIDSRLAGADDPAAPDRVERMRKAVLEPLREVCGVSDKVLSMALSGMLIGGSDGRPRWLEVGVSMIAVDTLVHNFLHRTGILQRLHGQHPYGPGCYRPGGCADIIETIARQIDAREFNRRYPKTFPRFVQYAIWSYCGQSGLDVCNGNHINDRKSCEYIYCQIFNICDRIRLYSSQ